MQNVRANKLITRRRRKKYIKNFIFTGSRATTQKYGVEKKLQGIFIFNVYFSLKLYSFPFFKFFLCHKQFSKKEMLFLIYFLKIAKKEGIWLFLLSNQHTNVFGVFYQKPLKELNGALNLIWYLEYARNIR